MKEYESQVSKRHFTENVYGQIADQGDVACQIDYSKA